MIDLARSSLLAIAVGVAAVPATAAGRTGAASPFQLVFDGRHTPAPTVTGIQHEGPFTTSASFCPSGYAVDTNRVRGTQAVLRTFTCGSGATFVARIDPLTGEHGGDGTWQIVDGTGDLASLRGKGTFKGVLLSEENADPLTIVFRSTSQGIVDFDASPPHVTVSNASVRKLKRPARAYVLTLAATVRDEQASIDYSLTVTDARYPLVVFATKKGAARDGAIVATVRVRVDKDTRAVRVRVTATDAVGNAGTAGRTVRLR